MYIYQCKNCGKEIYQDEHDSIFAHRETLKYFCDGDGLDKTYAEPKKENGKKIILSDVPRKYLCYPPKSYEQKVHETWYQQLIDGTTYFVDTGLYGGYLGKEEYAEFNSMLVYKEAKYLYKKPEDLFRDIWNKLGKE